MEGRGTEGEKGEEEEDSAQGVERLDFAVVYIVVFGGGRFVDEDPKSYMEGEYGTMTNSVRRRIRGMEEAVTAIANSPLR